MIAMLVEGKTKIILQLEDEKVLIRSKQAITAGDGLRKDILEGKDIFATSTAVNVFKYLNQKGVRTHFVGQYDFQTFIARKCKMIPVEIVARRIAFGSYLKRNPKTREGTVFKDPVVELFLKDDSRHDPFMMWNDGVNNGEGGFNLYDPKMPFMQGSLGETTDVLSPNTAMLLEDIVLDVFYLLEEAWQKQEITLVDLKIECGLTTDDKQIVVADVIDNDSWRIWPKGDKSQMLDKQIYRDASEMTDEARDILKRNYAQVAEMTGRFLP